MKKTKPIKTTIFPEAFLASPIIAGRIKKTQLTEESIPTDAEFLKILRTVKNSSFSQRFPTDQNGIKTYFCDSLNEIVDLNERTVFEFKKVGRCIGTQSQLTNKVIRDGAQDSWSTYINSVNTLISDLVQQTIEVANVNASMAKGNIKHKLFIEGKGEAEALKNINNQTIFNLKATRMRDQKQDWLNPKFTQLLQTQKELNAVTKKILSELAIVVNQVAVEKEKKILSDVPRDYTKINSGSGDAQSRPLDFLEELTGSIGAILKTIQSTARTEELLVQSQSLVNELKSQQEVLKNFNEELKEKAILLANQKKEIDFEKQEVEVARKALEEKANQLTLTSKYKSKFLANMSHELQTPLNSLQILANELIANRDGNLSVKQIEFAKTINSCGDDLIQLINDILDLSKIESGYISVNYNPVTFAEISRFVEVIFNPISEFKHLRFSISMDEALPEMIETDAQRLNQILKNLLSNSFKFTEKGEVQLRIYKAHHNWKTKNTSLDNAESAVAFEISDTGIGISKKKQNIIFEAFQQAEGSTSHKYGGTGLGLSISRGLSDLLGGSIELESDTNVGSKFTLFLPLKCIDVSQVEDEIGSNKGKRKLKSLPSSNLNRSDIGVIFVDEIDDDRTNLKPDDKILLIAGHDLTFAKIMLDQAHLHGLKAIVTTKENDVIDFINQFHPHAITMDFNMPDMSGWKILDKLKTDFTLRHIPVYIISGEDKRNKGLKRGARNFLLKPIKNESLSYLFSDIHDFKNKKIKNLLVVYDNEKDLNRILEAVQSSDIQVLTVKTDKEAVAHLMEKSFDCIILDLVLPDVEGLDIISDLGKNITGQETSIIIHSSGCVNKKQKAKLNRFAHSIITKSDASLDELVDQTALFMHRCHKELPDAMRERIESFYSRKDILTSKKVLIVDDDVRNLFALTTALERFGLDVIIAENGQEAIDILTKEKAIDVVLMDISMPEMNGYETMKNIRKNDKHKDLTIIAVTAKAMKSDRQRCIECGASDYITKPVNVEQLSSLMRVWLK